MEARRVLAQPTRALGDGYTLGRVLGSGSFGAVSECWDRATGESWAVKSISKAQGAMDPGAWEDLLTEVRVLGMFRGKPVPGVVQLREALETPTELHLVMECCRGGDLFDLLNAHGPMPEAAARLVFRQLACALRDLHFVGVLHRDIKPENVLFDAPAADALYSMTTVDSAATVVPEVQAKLADFGLACVLAPGTKTKGYVGSKRYVAPELVQGRAYGRRADVWSLGVVLCAVLTGRLPFCGRTLDDDQGLRQAICRGRVNFSQACWAGVSEGAKDLVRAMLQVQPAKRLTAFDLVNHPWVLGLPASTTEAAPTLTPPLPQTICG